MSSRNDLPWPKRRHGMNPDLLFVQTLEDLHRSLNSTSEYEVLRASHLIRQLFLDGANSLFLLVNRTHRLKPEYHFTQVMPPAEAGSWCAGDSLLPNYTSDEAPPAALEWDKFLKIIVASHGTTNCSLHDVIDFFAHVAGGVHLAKPRKECEIALTDLHEHTNGQAMSPLAETLRAIGRIVLNGLSEVKEHVLGVSRFEGGSGFAICAALILDPMEGGQENYLLDIGQDLARNRVTIFLDAHGDLCVRIYSANGKIQTVRAGSAGGAYRYGERTWLVCEIGQQTDGVLIHVESSSWDISRVLHEEDGPSFSLPIPCVVGSDVRGRSQGSDLPQGKWTRS